MNKRQMSSTAVNQTDEVDPAPISYLSETFWMYFTGKEGYKPSFNTWDYLSFPTLQAVLRLRRKKKENKVPPIPISATTLIICYSEIIIIGQHIVCLYLEGKVFFQSTSSSWVRKKQINWVLKCWIILLSMRTPQNKSNSN